MRTRVTSTKRSEMCKSGNIVLKSNPHPGFPPRRRTRPESGRGQPGEKPHGHVGRAGPGPCALRTDPRRRPHCTPAGGRRDKCRLLPEPRHGWVSDSGFAGGFPNTRTDRRRRQSFPRSRPPGAPRPQQVEMAPTTAISPLTVLEAGVGAQGRRRLGAGQEQARGSSRLVQPCLRGPSGSSGLIVSPEALAPNPSTQGGGQGFNP